MINGIVTVAKEEQGVDERGGLPSASGLSRVAACPGSFQMESKAGSVDTSSPAAERGTRIHARMEGDDIELIPEEELVAKEMAEYDDILLDCDELIREVRLWYSWSDGEKLFSGKIDVGGIDKVTGNTVLVNYKTGRGQETVEGNWQAMAESLLFHKFYGNKGKDVVYTFNQPESIFNKVVSGTFTEADLHKFERKILAALHRSKTHNPPLMPSEFACKWCKAVAICPAARWKVSDATDDDSTPLAELKPADRTAVLERIQAAEKLVSESWQKRKKEARDLISNNSSAIPGWQLRKGRNIQKIDSVQDVYKNLAELGVTTEEFFGACSISYSKLKGLVGDANLLDEKLGGAIKQSRVKDSLIKSN